MRLDGITDSMDMNLRKLWEIVRDKERLACCIPWSHKEYDMTEHEHSSFYLAVWSQEQFIDLFLNSVS